MTPIADPKDSTSRGTAATTAGPWTDPAGDVALANADLIGGNIVVGNGRVELLVQFADAPFPDTATHYIDWCIDPDQNPNTGSMCGSGDLIGADVVVSLRRDPGHHIELAVLYSNARSVVLDFASHARIDRVTHTIRVCFEHDLLGNDSDFNYLVGSIFGGSFGANDFAPQTPGFRSPTGAFTNEIGTPGPCCPNASEACDAVGRVVDDLCPCEGPWRNHREYVACVAGATKSVVADLDECFSEAERVRIGRCVVGSRETQRTCGQAAGEFSAARPEVHP